MKKKLQIIIEIEVDIDTDNEDIIDNDTTTFAAIHAKQLMISGNMTHFLGSENKVNLGDFNIIAFQEVKKNHSLMRSVNQGRQFESFLELQQAALKVGIDQYNSNIGIPSSLGTDFSLNKTPLQHLSEIKK